MRYTQLIVLLLTVAVLPACASREYVYRPVEGSPYLLAQAEARERRAAKEELGLASRRYESGLLARLEDRQLAAYRAGGQHPPAYIYHSAFTTGTYTTYPGPYYFGPGHHGGFHSGGFHSGAGLHIHGGYHGNPSFHFGFGGHCP